MSSAPGILEKMPSSTSLAAVRYVASRGHNGVTCSELGLHLYPTDKTTTNRAREGGAVLRRLEDQGLVASSLGWDKVHTVWTLTAAGMEVASREYVVGSASKTKNE